MVLITEEARQYLLHSSQFPERRRSLRLQQLNLSGSSNSSQSAAGLTRYQTESTLTRSRDRVAGAVTCKPREQSLDQSKASRGPQELERTWKSPKASSKHWGGGDRIEGSVWNQVENGKFCSNIVGYSETSIKKSHSTNKFITMFSCVAQAEVQPIRKSSSQSSSQSSSLQTC